jgi:hypothetical protein
LLKIKVKTLGRKDPDSLSLPAILPLQFGKEIRRSIAIVASLGVRIFRLKSEIKVQVYLVVCLELFLDLEEPGFNSAQIKEIE